MLKRASISKKFAVSFGALITIFLAVTAVTLNSFSSLKTADEWNSHTYNVLDHSASLIGSVVNKETGVRGFLVSGDKKFLEPYDLGKETFDRELSELLTITADNPEQQARLRRIGEVMAEWHANVAEPEIALGSDPATLDEARAIEASGIGKSYIDSLRAVHQEFEDAERSLLSVRSATKDNTMSLATTILMVGAGLMLVGSAAIGWLLNRNIGGAVTEMTNAMTELADGNNAIMVPSVDRHDEIGAMAKAVQVFKDNAIRNAELVKEQENLKAGSEAERQRAQEKAIESERQLVVESFGKAMSRLADKDLSFRITDQVPSAYEELKENFNSSIASLESVLIEVGQTARTIVSGSGEIRTAADELSKRTEHQAASVEETAAAVDEITVTVNTTAESSKNAGNLVQKTKNEANASSEVVQSAVQAMDEIKKSSDQIASIIGVIDDIAFQTNLLALNAGVEAARAGDAGKGFAVVAQEVRELAQRSANAAREIKDLITTSGAQVKNGVALVDKTGIALQSIALSVEEVEKLVSSIARASEEQATGLREINQAVNTIDQGTQQNATMVEEVTASSHTLTSEIKSLNLLLSSFQTGNSQSGRQSGNFPMTAPAASKSNESPARALGAKVALAFGKGGAATALKDDNWDEF